MNRIDLLNACWDNDTEHTKFVCYGAKDEQPNAVWGFKLTGAADEYIKSKADDENNVFFLPALFAKDATKKTKDNFVKCKVLWADLDLKVMPKGSTPSDCAAQLKMLPAPFLGSYWVVATGHGLHAYWVLDKFLERDDWELCANYLDTVLTENGVIHDKITTDCARMLRAPDTVNHKSTPVKTKILKTNSVVLDTEKLLKKSTKPPVKTPSREKNKPQDLIGSDYPPSDAFIVATKCPFIGQFSKDGFHEDEPAWNAAVNAIRLCENGVEAIHQFSAKSAQYKESETAYKIAAKERANVSPTTCEYLKEFGFCKNCKHYKKITAPIHLGYSIVSSSKEIEDIEKEVKGYRVQECTAHVPQFPWQVGENGGVGIMSEDKLVAVCSVAIYIIDLLAEDYNDSTVLTAIIHAKTPHRPTTFKLPLKYLADSKKFIGEFNARKIFPIEPKLLAAYIKKYIANLEKNNVKPQLAVNSLGWQKTGSFVYSSKGNALDKNGENINYIFDSKASNFIKGYTQKGTLDSWHDIFKIYGTEDVYIPHLFSLLCAIGTPLLPFTSAKGIVLSLCSCSGSGKTLAHKVAMAVWGDPETAGLLGTHDTHNALIGRMAAVKNLPLRLDEITILPPKMLSGIVYELVNGKGRARATLDGSLSGVASEWQTLTLVSTNSSLLDQDFTILSEAERNRVLELHVRMPKTILADAKILSSIINNNYGLIGELFIKDIIAHKEEWKKFIEAFQTRTGTMVESSKRFWISCGAIAFAAVKFCLKLGFEIDHERLLTWFTSFIKESEEDNYRIIQENRGFSTLEEMIVSLRDSLEGSIKIVNMSDNSPLFIPNKAVLAYILRDINQNIDYFYVRAGELKTFLKRHYQESFKRVKAELQIPEPKSKRFGENILWVHEFKLGKDNEV